MLDVTTESRKLVRLDQPTSQATSRQGGEKVARVPPRSMCSVTPLAAIHHQYYKVCYVKLLCVTENEVAVVEKKRAIVSSSSC